MEEVLEVKKEQPVNLLTKENVILLACSLFLGVLFDFLFFDKPMGISCPIFVVVFYGILLWNMKKHLVLKLDFAWLLSIPVLALSLTFLIFSNNVFRVLNILAIPILIVAQTVLISRNNKYRWYSAKFASDVIIGLFGNTLVHVFKPFMILSGLIKRKAAPGKYAVASKIFIGLLISIPLLLVVTMLLASADQVFSHYLGNIPDFFENINIEDFIAQTILAFIICVTSFSYIYSLSAPKIQGIEVAPEELKPLKRVWDPVIITTVLISINIVYVFFTFIQFTYLFGSLDLGLPKDFTYAEYARRGFFELVFVTLINLSILLGCIGFAKQGGILLDRILKVLKSLLVACTMVMLVSAHIRMTLYEEAYGYTYLRILTHAFMFFIFALLLVALYKIWVDKVLILRWYIVITLVAYVLINYVNIDVIIAKQNIERYHKTQKLDISYLTELSYDAVPYTVELLKDKNRAIAGGIENDLFLKKENLKKKNHWQSFNISEAAAKRILAKYELKYDPEKSRTYFDSRMD
ncbi:MAG: DUF4173 domain-containing protein [Clostridia bacterium]|nr:DUF4173 domain-containing protein [Clostridia bacterium]